MDKVKEVLKRSEQAEDLPNQADQWFGEVDRSVSGVPDLIEAVLEGVLKSLGNSELSAEELRGDREIRGNILSVQHRIKSFVHSLTAFCYESLFGCGIASKPGEGLVVFVDEALDERVEMLIDTLFKDIVSSAITDVDLSDKDEEYVLEDIEGLLGQFMRDVKGALSGFAVEVATGLVEVPDGFVEALAGFYSDPKVRVCQNPEVFLDEMICFLKANGLVPADYVPAMVGGSREEAYFIGSLGDFMRYCEEQEDEEACGEECEECLKDVARGLLGLVKEAQTSGKVFERRRPSLSVCGAGGDAKVLQFSPRTNGGGDGGRS